MNNVSKPREYVTLNKNICLSKNVDKAYPFANYSEDTKYGFYRYREEKMSGKVMLNSIWSQDWPYNSFRIIHKKRDLDSLNRRNPAGCAYTALGQLFKFWKEYPLVQEFYPKITELFDIYHYLYIDDETTVFNGKTNNFNCSPETEYKEAAGYKLDDIKKLMKNIKPLLDYRYSFESGSSGVPIENRLQKILKKMRSSKKWCSEEAMAQACYESIILNGIPVLAWVQLDRKVTTGHFIIIDGCVVDRKKLLETKSFKESCLFHFNYGWGITRKQKDKLGSITDYESKTTIFTDYHIADNDGNIYLTTSNQWANAWDGLRPGNNHFNNYRKLYFYAPEITYDVVDENAPIDSNIRVTYYEPKYLELTGKNHDISKKNYSIQITQRKVNGGTILTIHNTGKTDFYTIEPYIKGKLTTIYGIKTKTRTVTLSVPAKSTCDIFVSNPSGANSTNPIGGYIALTDHLGHTKKISIETTNSFDKFA